MGAHARAPRRACEGETPRVESARAGVGARARPRAMPRRVFGDIFDCVFFGDIFDCVFFLVRAPRRVGMTPCCAWRRARAAADMRRHPRPVLRLVRAVQSRRGVPRHELPVHGRLCGPRVLQVRAIAHSRAPRAHTPPVRILRARPPARFMDGPDGASTGAGVCLCARAPRSPSVCYLGSCVCVSAGCPARAPARPPVPGPNGGCTPRAASRLFFCFSH